MSFERDDFDGLHTSDCSWITAPYFAPDDCDCDPRELLPDGMLADARDGAALRKLREALPQDADGFEMGAWVRREDDPQYPGWGFRVDASWWADDGVRNASGRGATIAEAADKCREALSER